MNGQIDFNQFNAPVRRVDDQDEHDGFYTTKNPDENAPADEQGLDAKQSQSHGGRGKGKKKILTFGT